MGTIVVVCLMILSNAIIYKNVLDMIYLTFLLIMAIRLILIEKRG